MKLHSYCLLALAAVLATATAAGAAADDVAEIDLATLDTAEHAASVALADVPTRPILHFINERLYICYDTAADVPAATERPLFKNFNERLYSCRIADTAAAETAEHAASVALADVPTVNPTAPPTARPLFFDSTTPPNPTSSEREYWKSVPSCEDFKDGYTASGGWNEQWKLPEDCLCGLHGDGLVDKNDRCKAGQFCGGDTRANGLRGQCHDIPCTPSWTGCRWADQIWKGEQYQATCESISKHADGSENVGFCPSGTRYDPAKVENTCTTAVCDAASAEDVEACCTKTGSSSHIKATCLSTSTDAGFCPRGTRYDPARARNKCTSAACDAGSAEDVAACCTKTEEDGGGDDDDNKGDATMLKVWPVRHKSASECSTMLSVGPPDGAEVGDAETCAYAAAADARCAAAGSRFVAFKEGKAPGELNACQCCVADDDWSVYKFKKMKKPRGKSAERIKFENEKKTLREKFLNEKKDLKAVFIETKKERKDREREASKAARKVALKTKGRGLRGM